MATIDTLEIKIKADSSKAVEALNKLSASLANINTNSSAKSLKLLNTNVNSFGTTATKTNSKLSSLAKTILSFALIKKIGISISSSIKDINNYIEASNLFSVSMGEFYDQADKWSDLVSDKMGIDPAEFMKAEGIFMAMSKGMGITTEQSYKMAKGLTEMSYDLSSFINLPIEEALTKMRSALAGEIEPLRGVGVSITQATLQQKALELGITESVNAMTDAEKSVLRYKAILDSLKNMGAIGDFARTLESPANAIRILQMQITQLSRAIGSIFIPILTTVIPYINAFVQVLTKLISTIASLFGFKMPEWKTKDWESGSGVLAENMEDASGSAKKLKDYTMGFDELNIINPDTGSGSGTSASGGGLDIDIEDVWTEAMLDSIDNKINEIKANIEAFGSVLYDMFIKPLTTIDLEPLSNSLRNLWDSLLPFAETIGKGLYWVYINVLVPLAKFVIEDSLPTFFNTLASALDIATEALKGYGEWFTSNLENITNATAIIASLMGAFGIVTTVAGPIKAFISSCISMNSIIGATVKLISSSLTPILSALTPAILPIIAAVVALGSAIYVAAKHFDSIILFAKNFAEKIGLASKVQAIANSFGKLWVALGDCSELFEVIGTIVGGTLMVGLSLLGGLISGLTTLIDGAILVLTGLFDILSALGEFIVGVFTGDLSLILESVQSIITGIYECFGGLLEGTIVTVLEFVSGVIQWFTTLWDTLVGHSIVPDTILAIEEWFLSLPDLIFGSLEDFINGTIQFFTNMWNSITLGIQTFWLGIVKWFTTNVAPKLTLKYWTTQFSGLVQGMQNKLEELRQAISSKWEAIKTWYSQNVAPKLTLEYWIEQFANLKEGLVTTVKGAINTCIEKFNMFIDWLNAHLQFSWEPFEIAGNEIVPGGTIQLFTIPRIPQVFEKGGFIEDGLFTMNKGEIAGKFDNGRSVVANNEQIIQGISQGVYEAFARAFTDYNSNEKELNVNVYLDGQQINSSVEKARDENGVDIFGNEIGYTY